MRTRLALVLSALVAGLGTPASGTASVWMHFSRISNLASVLSFTWQDDSSGVTKASQSWRAGSGYTTDECQATGGWLPVGFYDVIGHFNTYSAPLIRGRVWQLQDKRCNGGTGTLRTDLFIQSQETSDGGQSCVAPYGGPFCWLGTGDYASYGSIKVAHAPPWPSDIARANNAWDSWDGRHGYFTFRAGLYVS